MKRRILSRLRPSYQLALAAFLIGVVLGCTNEEATHMKEVAGTYAMKSTDRLANSLLDGSTMTLDADGTWRSATKVDGGFDFLMTGRTPWFRSPPASPS